MSTDTGTSWSRLWSRGKAFVLGIVIATAAIANGAYDIGRWAWEHLEVIDGACEKVAENLPSLSSVCSPSATRKLTKDQLYVHMLYPNKIQTWRLTIHKASGDGAQAVVGEVSDPKTGGRGTIHGYLRHDALVLDYASASVDRPGYGTLLLRENTSAVESDPLMYSGAVMEHDCECKDGTVRFNGPIHVIPVIITSRVTPDAAMLKKIAGSATPFRIDGPSGLIKFPTDLQRLVGD